MLLAQSGWNCLDSRDVHFQALLENANVPVFIDRRMSDWTMPYLTQMCDIKFIVWFEYKQCYFHVLVGLVWLWETCLKRISCVCIAVTFECKSWVPEVKIPLIFSVWSWFLTISPKPLKTDLLWATRLLNSSKLVQVSFFCCWTQKKIFRRKLAI